MKPRTTPILLGSALLLTLFVMATMVFFAGGPPSVGAAASQAITSSVPPAQKHVQAPTAAQVGMPMIAHGGAALTDGQLRAFVESHHFVGGDVIGGGNPHVTAITHLTAAQYKAQYGIGLQLPDTESLVQVTLAGPFHLTRINAPASAVAHIAALDTPTVREVFDPATGNLEAWGL